MLETHHLVSRFLKEIHHPFRLTHLLKPRTRPAKDSMEVRVLEGQCSKNVG